MYGLRNIRVHSRIQGSEGEIRCRPMQENAWICLAFAALEPCGNPQSGSGQNNVPAPYAGARGKGTAGHLRGLR